MGTSLAAGQRMDVNVHLMKTCEMAAFLSITPGTARRWRLEGKGPPYVKVGRRCIRYHPAHVAEWARDNMCVYPSARGGQENKRVTL